MSIFDPTTFTEGTGLLDDVTAVVKESRFVMFDYQGKAAASPALHWSMEVEGVDDLVDQYWSLGKSTDWSPSEDGHKLVAIGKATGLNKNSNAGILLQSLVDRGFPTEKMTDDAACFEGLKAHFLRVAAPVRAGIGPKPPRADGKVFESTILTVSEIYTVPGEKAAKGKGGAKASSAKSPAGQATADVGEEATNTLLAILAENPDGIAKSALPGLALKKVATSPDRNAIITKIFQDDFLAGGPWTFANGRITM